MSETAHENEEVEEIEDNAEQVDDLNFCGPPAPPKLTLEQKIGRLAELVRLAPKAEHTLGALRATYNIYVPPEVEDVAKWIEDNWQPPAPPPKPAARPRNYVRLRGSFTATEYGSVSYTRTVSGSANAEISVEDLREMAEECSSREELLEKLSEYHTENLDRNIDDYGDASYGDENAEGTDDEEIEANFEDTINDWLDEHPNVDPDNRDAEDEE